MSSPLIDKGIMDTVSTGPMGFPRALLLPTYHPPQHVLLPIGTADGRNNQGAPDLGAFEANASVPGDPPQKMANSIDPVGDAILSIQGNRLRTPASGICFRASP